MTDKAYLSFIEQTLHYFGRPHQDPATAPVQSPAAWRGEAMPSLDEMSYRLSEEEVAEILAATENAMAMGPPTKELTADDFPLPLLAPRIKQWREDLGKGVGFVVVRGVPVDRWSQEAAELFFWCFGLHIGRPGEQNP